MARKVKVDSQDVLLDQTAVGALTDSTGGSAAGTTLAAIVAPGANATTSLSADMTAVKNALAVLAKQVNAIIAAGGKSGARITVD